MECWPLSGENQALALEETGCIVAGRCISGMDCVPSSDAAPAG